VQGWVITHRVVEDTLRWTLSFVTPHLQSRAGILPLWLETARRQRRDEALRQFTFTVAASQPRMLRFTVRRMRPWLTTLGRSLRVMCDLEAKLPVRCRDSVGARCSTAFRMPSHE
jgi:hypothetical protein